MVIVCKIKLAMQCVACYNNALLTTTACNTTMQTNTNNYYIHKRNAYALSGAAIQLIMLSRKERAAMITDKVKRVKEL